MKTLLFGWVAAIAFAGQVSAQETKYGAALYEHYCTTCHGTGALGDGEMVPFLTLAVPDLTRLSERNDGEFPMGQAIKVIDGRTKLRGHIGPMPYFAPLFARETVDTWDEYDSVVDANGRILLLAKYLESIQTVDDTTSD